MTIDEIKYFKYILLQKDTESRLLEIIKIHEEFIDVRILWIQNEGVLGDIRTIRNHSFPLYDFLIGYDEFPKEFMI